MGWVLVRDCRWLHSCYILMWWTEDALVSVPLTWALIPLWGASQVVLVVKNPPAKAEDIRDAGSIPDLGRSPDGGDETSNLITPSKPNYLPNTPFLIPSHWELWIQHEIEQDKHSVHNTGHQTWVCPQTTWKNIGKMQKTSPPTLRRWLGNTFKNNQGNSIAKFYWPKCERSALDLLYEEGMAHKSLCHIWRTERSTQRSNCPMNGNSQNKAVPTEGHLHKCQQSGAK